MKTIVGTVCLLFFSSLLFLAAEPSPPGQEPASGENFTVRAPAPASISEVDFSEARLSIAGPARVFMRGIEYHGAHYSAVIEAVDESGERWRIAALYNEEENMAPPSTILDLAEVTPVGDDRIVIRGIVVEDTSYTASFSIDRTGRLTLETTVEPAEMPEGFIDKLGNFKDLLMEAAEEKYVEQIGYLEDERMERLQRIAELEKEKSRLADALKEAREEAEKTAEPAGPVFTTTVMEGFIRTVPQLGSWEVTPTEATHLESDHYFAKLVLPLSRQSKPTLYSFQTRSRSYGWTGVGMELFAVSEPKENESAVESGGERPGEETSGFNNSLLVWLTRDPEFYGTEKTRLQLFRSGESVMMELVLDAVVSEPLSEFLDVEILWEPAEEYITISVNGIEKLKYKTWFGMDSRLEAALRSLGGGVDFKALKVLTTN